MSALARQSVPATEATESMMNGRPGRADGKQAADRLRVASRAECATEELPQIVGPVSPRARFSGPTTDRRTVSLTASQWTFFSTHTQTQMNKKTP